MGTRPLAWILGIILLSGFAESLKLAEPCLPSKCKLPNCKCSTTESDNSIPLAKTPQIIMSSFDDGVTPVTYDLFTKSIFNRKNPDGCPIGITHFLSHEYADYTKVHDLWLRGHEIALHSVTYVNKTILDPPSRFSHRFAKYFVTMTLELHHRADDPFYRQKRRHNTMEEGYWSNINLTTIKMEFGDIRTMANHFGFIPIEEMRGMRLPFLQPSGNVSFQGLQELNLAYDSSLPTRTYVNPPMWPYTFEYASHQDCAIEVCPTASFPNVWEVPMVMWFDEKDIPCSMIDACVNIPKDAESITKWMIRHFERHYKGNRAPFPLFMHAAWFLRNPENFKAYVNFLDYVQKMPDVYFMTVNKTIEWIKNPKSIDAKKPFGECTVNKSPKICEPLGCSLKTLSGEGRWFTSCATTCPNKYPWLGNPLGN